MIVNNLSRPNQEPQDGDFLEYISPKGSIVRKHYYAPKLQTEQELLEQKVESEKSWRNGELSATDWIVPVVDHPKHAAYLVYRQELRDYPQQPDFPNGERPVKP